MPFISIIFVENSNCWNRKDFTCFGVDHQACQTVTDTLTGVKHMMYTVFLTH